MMRRSAYTKRRVVTLVGGEKLVNVHKRHECVGPYCAIHRFSSHGMRNWRQHWRSDRQLMERICPEHGCGHPDPDHLSYIAATRGAKAASIESIHGCCMCCSYPKTLELDHSWMETDADG